MTTNRFVGLAFTALIYTTSARSAAADTFGSGANTFNIEFVTIGNPGNAADDVNATPDFAGSVPYTYHGTPTKGVLVDFRVASTPEPSTLLLEALAGLGLLWRRR